MPREPSFEPRQVVRDGKETGRWRIYVPDPTRKTGNRPGSGFREIYFKDFDAAAAYGNELRAAYHAQQADLILAKPADALRFQELEMRAQRLGYDSPEALIDSIEERHEMDPSGPTIADLLDNYALHKDKDWNADTKSTFNTCTRPFDAIRGQKAAAMSPTEWERFFNALRKAGTYATSTYNRSLTFLKAAYEHAIHVQLLNTNPARNVARARKDLARDPVIVKAPAITTFFAHAVDHHIETVPYWSLCFFGGARPDSEAYRVRWEDILWDRPNAAGGIGELIIPKPSDRRASHTKTKRSRYVELEPNLRAWLEPFRRDQGFLAPIGRKPTPSKALVKKAREAISRGAYLRVEDGEEPQPVILWGTEHRDLTRHTYATAFAKAHHGETGVNSRLKNNLGHGSEETGDTFYKNPHLTNEEAKAIFAIVPSPAQIRAIKRYIANNHP